MGEGEGEANIYDEGFKLLTIQISSALLPNYILYRKIFAELRVWFTMCRIAKCYTLWQSYAILNVCSNLITM